MTEEKEYTDAEEKEFEALEQKLKSDMAEGKVIDQLEFHQYIEMFQRWRKYMGFFADRYNPDLHNPSTQTQTETE